MKNGDRMTNVGRLTGKSIGEMRFRTAYGSDINVGEILVVKDRDKKLYIRVTDLQYGAEASDESWPERTAGNMIRQDGRGESFPIHDREKRLYTVGIAMPLGYEKDGEFRKAKSIPAHFSPIRRINREDFEFLGKFTGDLPAGHLRSGENVIEELEVGINGEDLPSHVGVFATTGMGKSNLMKVLAASVMRSGKYGMLILDPHGEYYDGGGEKDRKGLKDLRVAARRLSVYSARKLYGGEYTRIRLSSSEIEIRDIMNLYEFSDAQKDALVAATRAYGKNWLVELNKRSSDEIYRDFHGETYESTIAVIKRRLRTLFSSQIITSDPSISVSGRIIEDLMNRKVVLVDVSSLFETEELLVSSVIVRAVFHHNKEKYGKPEEFGRIPPMVLALEEAQRVLGMSRGNIFSQIAREGRKFRTGLCAVSQQPKLINNEVISQFNTLFIMGLADRRDRQILKESARQDIGQLDNEIQMLMPGEGLITSPGSPFALPVKIHLYEKLVGKLNEEYVEPEDTKPAAPDRGFF